MRDQDQYHNNRICFVGLLWSLFSVKIRDYVCVSLGWRDKVDQRYGLRRSESAGLRIRCMIVGEPFASLSARIAIRYMYFKDKRKISQ